MDSILYGDDIPLPYRTRRNDIKAIEEGCRLNLTRAGLVVNFFRTNLRHAKGELAGQPFILDEWQVRNIILPLFGWERPVTKKSGEVVWYRRFLKAGVWLPKKMGKSALVAGIMLYLKIADDEAGALVVLLATDLKHTAVVFDPAAEMVRASPNLRKLITVIDSQKRLVYRNKYGNKSIGVAISSEKGQGEGWDCSGILIDELHAFDEAKGRARIDQFEWAGAARRNPLHLIISTAGANTNGIGYERFLYHKAVLDGDVDDTGTFALICEAGADEDPGDPVVWRRVNPMLGVTVPESEIRQAYKECKNDPAKLSAFKRYRLNIWGSSTRAWLSPAKWNACNGLIDVSTLKGRRNFGGLDLADKTDLSAFALCFPPDGFYTPDIWTFLVWYWIPDEDIEIREKTDRVRYRDFAARSNVTFTQGPVTDTLRVRDDIMALHRDFGTENIGYDPVPARHVANDLYNYHGVPMLEIRQSPMIMHPAVVIFEDLVKTERIRHGDNEVLRRQATQVQVKITSGGLLWPVKGDNRTNTWFRIDGIMACLMAVSTAMDAMGMGNLPMVKAV